MGRLPVTATGKLAHSLRTSERLKSAEFLAIEGRLATLDPHNKCNDLLNLITRRSPVNDNLVNIYTEYEDIVRIGDEIEELYNNVTCAVLDEYGVVVNDAGKVEDHSSIDSQTCEITAPYLVYSSIVSEVDGLSTEEADLWNYVNDYNENKDPAYQIHGTFWFETDPASTCYICVDDVLVHRQNRTKLVHKNGKWVSRTVLGDWIFHSVGYIEHNGLVYILEAPSQEKLYARILAFLLKNNLQDKYLIFFTDGEEALKAEANRVFEMWPHKLYLDYYHLKENLEGRFSRIFKAGKIVDDRSKVEYFKNQCHLV